MIIFSSFFPKIFLFFLEKIWFFFQQKNRKILIVFHCFCTFLCEFWFCLAYLSIFLRVCPSKNVEIMCWIALGFDTFSHETIWSWSSRVWVGLCPLDTTKVSFSRKTRFWGRFLVLKAPTNLNCDQTKYRRTTWISTKVTLIHHIKDTVVSGSFLTEVEDTELWHAEPTVWPWFFGVVVVFSCTSFSFVKCRTAKKDVGKRNECQYLLTKHLLFDFWCSS